MARARRFGSRELPFAFALACVFLLATAVFLAAGHASVPACKPTDLMGICWLHEKAKHAYALGIFGAALLAGGFAGAALALRLQRLRQARGTSLV